MKWKQELFEYFPQTIRKALDTVKYGESLNEIRLRVNRPIQLVYSQSEELLDYVVSIADCKLLLGLLCEHSVYSHEDDLNNCFVTLPNGCRVGVCGRFLCEGGSIKNIVEASFFNFRIARQCIGAADDAMRYISKNGRIASTLIISAPGGGKTTLLRDAARNIASGKYGKKVCIADERSEIAASRHGIPSLDVGERTDVLDACPKAEAMRLMIRTMSPDVIITDEIGTLADALAVMDAASCGVSVIASAHAQSLSELKQRPFMRELADSGVFENILLLCREAGRILVRRAA
ncbi:MAG: stage III sporulation protein AA [Clostridia bacterium]|nr:stage III sporulation protein AA [Clostridia bacterium]